MGTFSSVRALAASTVAERNKVIYWETGSVADNITGRGYQYLFRTEPEASKLARAAADLADLRRVQRRRDVGDRPVRAFVEDLHRQPEKPSDETRGICRLVLHGAAILHPNDELANASGDQSPTHAPDMQNRT